MIEIVGVRFQNSGKVYYFSPNGLTLTMSTKVIVETAKGREYGIEIGRASCRERV